MFDSIVLFASQHQFAIGVALFWIFSALVSNMPEPGPADGPGYRTLYGFCHTIAGNLTTAFGSKIPGLPGAKALILLVLIPLVLAPSACVGYRVHPGSVNVFDSVSYDALLAAKSTIDAARPQLQAGKLPASTIPAFNALVKAYDAAYPLWQDWHNAAQAGLSSAGDKLVLLNRALADLTAAVSAYKGGK